MKHRNSLVLAVVAVSMLATVDRAGAQVTNTFLPATGFWHDPDAWFLGHEPNGTEEALIPSTGICTIVVDDVDAVAQLITVEGGLEIETGAVLTFTDTSTIDGTVVLDGTMTADGDLTVSAGAIVDMDSDGATPPSFTSRIEGTGTLTVSGIVRGTGEIDITLVNPGLVQSGSPDSGGTQKNLEVAGTLSGTGEWRASFGTRLIVQSSVTGSAAWRTPTEEEGGHGPNNRIVIQACCAVSGPVQLNERGGHLEVEESFCTTGHIQMFSVLTSATWIEVHTGRVARFNAASCSSCP